MRRIVTTAGLGLALAVSALGGQPAAAAPANAGTVIVQLDNPSQGEQNMSPNWIAGWAIDTAATAGTGVASVAVYIDGDQNSGRLLGQARYGADRPDVAARYNNPAFRYSGFTFDMSGVMVPPGSSHTFTVVARTAANDTATASASGVTLAPGWNNGMTAQGYPPAPPTGYMGGYNYGPSSQPMPPAPPSNTGQTSQPSGSDVNGLPIIGNNPYGDPIQPTYYDGGTFYNYSGYNPYYGGYGYGNAWNGYGYGYGNGNGYGWNNPYYGGYYPGSYYSGGYGGYPWGYPGSTPYRYR